jgi:hypothetical protein
MDPNEVNEISMANSRQNIRKLVRFVSAFFFWFGLFECASMWASVLKSEMVICVWWGGVCRWDILIFLFLLQIAVATARPNLF